MLGWHVPGTTIDPFLFAVLMGAVLSQADPDDVAAMRRWPLPRWSREVNRHLSVLAATTAAAPAPGLAGEPAEPPTPQKIATPLPAIAGARPEALPAVPAELRRPDGMPPAVEGPPRRPPLALVPPLSPLPAPPGDGGEPPESGPPIPAPPEGLPTELREAWIQARTRAGEYCRGLGNYAAKKTGEIVGEVWDREEVTLDADREQRLRTAALIREKAADAIATGQTAEKLASVLGNATKDWARSWLRITRTELQGALNDGAITQAIRAFGADARVARVPNAGACEACRSLTLDDEGRPITWPVADLLAHGTNVGKPRAQWQATVWPIHPRCKCTVQVIPPGTRMAADGTLERDPGPEETP